MTKDEIEGRVLDIKNATINRDYDVAHWLEDKLYAAFVNYVVEIGGDLGELAKLVIKTQTYDFPRYL